MKDIGVFCIWFARSELSLFEYDMDPYSQTHHERSNEHIYVPISDYVCTLNTECFGITHKSNFKFQSVEVNTTTVAKDKKKIMEAAHIKLTENCLSSIFELLEPNEKEMSGDNSSSSKSEVIYVSDETTADDACSSDTWITLGNMTLKMADKDGKLSDKHINMGQHLIKQHFQAFAGCNLHYFNRRKTSFLYQLADCKWCICQDTG